MGTAERTRKTTMNLTHAVGEKLDWLGHRLDLTQTQVMRESIEVRYRLQQEIDNNGTVLIERENGDRVELLLTGSD